MARRGSARLAALVVAAVLVVSALFLPRAGVPGGARAGSADVVAGTPGSQSPVGPRAPGDGPVVPGAQITTPADSKATPTPTQAPEPTPTTPAPPPGPDCAVLSCIALTFDDGPSIYTGTLLDELAAKGVHATFFVVGTNVAKYPDLIAREAAEGHAVGNHSWSHADLTKASPDQVASEIDTTATALATDGVTTSLVRPPYGSWNDALMSVLAARGDIAVLWSVDTEDWKNRDVGITTQRALAGAAPGAIVLMHDIRPTTVQAVPGIVDQLQAAGYTLVTVPELLGTTTPGWVYHHR